jgi:hypothetical protein
MTALFTTYMILIAIGFIGGWVIRGQREQYEEI